ncbi:MAG: glycosyltransferase family 4 protein [Clostridium sp.]|nr:glycosyltransferase family 4 protein [Ruminococcus flavefaciens]MCM1499468.1 glycosyltransferase family 4 protein [Clostridium sp.]
MNIVINAVLANIEPRGPGKYISNLLKGLSELDSQNQYYIYYGSWMSQYSFLHIKKTNFHFIELKIKNNQITRNWFLAVHLPLLCKKWKPDVLFLIDTQAIIIKPCRLVSTIHDLAEFEIPEKYPPLQALIRRCIVRRQIRLSDHIITVSKYSKKDICRRFHIPDNKVTVTYNSFQFSSKREKKAPQPYFLFVSEVERAKNLPVLLKAFAKLEPDIQHKFKIKVVGKKGNDYPHSMQLIEQLQLNKKVNFYGYVSDQELEDLYAQCYAFIFPSLFEGFGIPVLEAMGNGVPVICSDSSSLPEVGGDAVLTFDPLNENELAEQIKKIVTDDTLRTRMITAGYKRAVFFTSDENILKTHQVLTSK